MSCVIKHYENVFAFKKWIVSENFLVGGSGTKQFEHIRNANTQARMQGLLPHLPVSTVIRLRRSRFIESSVAPTIRNRRFNGERW